ncbi:hypothetical protein M378DRAFT_170034 [Amanita muscaria Koide BX008]|uniref:F-box domain-containing protein n=1 Tax=Amanita muscaria (strain Koide BX008) TaxID=946122 RepID=A0A0C2S841_AMAMK|nr:hypothetical protein M378DRAFT_170034 [Amanita muscaria Koide BX008]
MARQRTRNVSNNDQNVLCYPQKGLPALPLELLLLVVSHMKVPAIPRYGECLTWNQERERRESLRVLCQLCRSLRADLLPVLWERLEACTLRRPAHFMITPRAIAQILGQEVVGQLNLMINLTLPYASYVRVVNVAIQPKFSPTALPKLARAMTLMPNLHTVQIICKENMHKRSFEKCVYPSVRRASLPHQATSILSSFPEVVEVYINQSVWASEFRQFLQAVALHCRKVECFGWCSTYQNNYVSMDIVPQTLPNLRRLECQLKSHINGLVDPATFKNLEKFTLIVDGRLRDASANEFLAINIRVARKALAGSSAPNKYLVVYNDQTRVESFDAL